MPPSSPSWPFLCHLLCFFFSFLLHPFYSSVFSPSPIVLSSFHVVLSPARLVSQEETYDFPSGFYLFTFQIFLFDSECRLLLTPCVHIVKLEWYYYHFIIISFVVIIRRCHMSSFLSCSWLPPHIRSATYKDRRHIYTVNCPVCFQQDWWHRIDLLPDSLSKHSAARQQPSGAFFPLHCGAHAGWF